MKSRTDLQTVLINKIEYYLAVLNREAPPRAAFFEKKHADLGKEGRSRALKYKHRIEHSDNDYDLAGMIYLDILDSISNVQGGRPGLRGSRILRGLMLDGLCSYLGISEQKIRDIAIAEQVRLIKARTGNVHHVHIPPLNHERAALGMIQARLKRIPAPVEMQTIRVTSAASL